MLRLTENNSQPLMTKLQWLFAFLEHSQVSTGGAGCGVRGMLEGRPGLTPRLHRNPPAPASRPLLAVSCWAPVQAGVGSRAEPMGPAQCPDWAGEGEPVEPPCAALPTWLPSVIQLTV